MDRLGYSRFIALGSDWGTSISTSLDSPVGLCAWILEKVWTWSDHAEDLWEVLSPTQVLDNVTLYWLSSAAVSSARLYWESIAEVTTWFSQTGRRAHHRTYWVHRLPAGGTTPLPPMGRTSVPLDRPLGRAPAGRPLRRLGTTRPVHLGGSRRSEALDQPA